MIKNWFPASLSVVALNYMAFAALLIPAYLLYTYHPHFVTFFSDFDRQLFWYGAVGYLAIMPVYYATLSDEYIPKSRLIWRAIRHCTSRTPDKEERVAILAFIVKAFYLPLMLVWLVQHADAIYSNGYKLMSSDTFLPHGYWLLFNLAFLVDVSFFTLGYAIEHPKLGNEIRSVEPTALGWIVTLMCYPPFNGVTQQMLGWYSSDYPNFDPLWAQYLAGGLMLGLMSIYAWASVALCLRASNLTHRGIVDWGPYRWVRHPAYITKNLAWWIGSLPVLAAQWQMGTTQFSYAVAGVLGWSVIYYLRAVTEERHLGMDDSYLAYRRQVKYKFIPGVW
jgi:protein-S-isoprenylcysteine O-methyltransferase Ste14